jgi:hypothetical protein
MTRRLARTRDDNPSPTQGLETASIETDKPPGPRQGLRRAERRIGAQGGQLSAPLRVYRPSLRPLHGVPPPPPRPPSPRARGCAAAP